METPEIIQGRQLSAKEIEEIRELIARHPTWSRRQISIAVCERFNWRSPAGQLKDMSARLLLNKLAERGVIALPARQRRGGRQVLRAVSEPDLFESLCVEARTEALKELCPLEFILPQPRRPEARAFVSHLGRHHYLGFSGTAGQNLRYLVRDCHGRDLACVLFDAAAWKVKARDEFIGWSAAQRQARLGLIVNNTRFLILPHVRVPHLASHILGAILRRLRADWLRKYGCQPCLAETFVERDRFAGTCYRAANWRCVGETSGRSRKDRFHTLRMPIKDIYLYPLCEDFRERLCV